MEMAAEIDYPMFNGKYCTPISRKNMLTREEQFLNNMDNRYYESWAPWRQLFLQEVLSHPLSTFNQLFLSRGILHSDRKTFEIGDFCPDLDMQDYGHPDVLFLSLGIKPKEDPKDPEYPLRKLGVIVLGGGQAGVISAGSLRGMQMTGALDRVDGFIGVSAGIPDLIYTETGQNEEGVKIYYEDNTTPGKFLKVPKSKISILRRLGKLLTKGPAYSLVDTSVVGEIMRTTRLVDIDKLKSSKRELIAAVTNARTAEPEYFDIREFEDPIKGNDAGICIPGISTTPSVELGNGESYVDAGWSDPIPLEEAFRRGYTDVIILSNGPVIAKRKMSASFRSFVMEALARGGGYKYSKEMNRAIRAYDKLLGEKADYVHQVIEENNPYKRVFVIEPFDNYFSGPLEMNPRLLQTAFEDARDHTETLLSLREDPTGSRTYPRANGTIRFSYSRILLALMKEMAADFPRPFKKIWD